MITNDNILSADTKAQLIASQSVFKIMLSYHGVYAAVLSLRTTALGKTERYCVDITHAGIKALTLLFTRESINNHAIEGEKYTQGSIFFIDSVTVPKILIFNELYLR